MTYGMTKRQHECMVAIERYIAAHGYSPSLTELMTAIGRHSKAHVHRLLHSLQERGLVALLPGRARSVAVTEKGHDEARK